VCCVFCAVRRVLGAVCIARNVGGGRNRADFKAKWASLLQKKARGFDSRLAQGMAVSNTRSCLNNG